MKDRIIYRPLLRANPTYFITPISLSHTFPEISCKLTQLTLSNPSLSLTLFQISCKLTQLTLPDPSLSHFSRDLLQANPSYFIRPISLSLTFPDLLQANPTYFIRPISLSHTFPEISCKLTQLTLSDPSGSLASLIQPLHQSTTASASLYVQKIPYI